MNVNEVVNFVDKLVFDKTGKHLDDVQTAVVEGTWERKTYDDIAQECNVTKNHVGDVGAELWQLLSEILDEDIKKTNFRSTIERLKITSLPIIIQNNNKQNNNHTFHFGSQALDQYNNQDNNIHKSKSITHDLTLAPQIINFYNRNSELQTIYNWIFNQNTNLISILGLYGIGKTTLVKRFVDLHLDKFDVIIWRCLKYPKSLDLLIDDLLDVCQREVKKTIDDKLKQLFKLFREQRCLIILDDVQNIFVSGEFAGQYKTEYQDYQNFFSLMTRIEHQSSVILISEEKSTEMESLNQDLYPIQSLELSGLNNVDILHNIGLNKDETWLNLVNLYAGNPAYLKSIAISIKNIFDGKVSEFISENELVITKDMQSLFAEVFNKKISPIEQEIILSLSKFDQPVTREYLKANLKERLELSSTNFINGLESLQRRFLVKKITEDKILFDLFSVFREYVRIFCEK
ncbi:ATP-binding protein [Anabaena sp. CA = ATCC 33047]|uniref:ATP-binding protein n=1 Tax=Anabaena sp. (strain CA / ATCC 33047) TaxID=52271 RepID=UPI00083792D5|nr:ATP-binding protein [Anabaena sp. CA = ATCC 33047]